MKFLIDANILISGYKVFYPMDVHVSYWNVKALKEGYSVVTYEISANGGKKIKIPDVCSHFDVSCMTINEVLRKLQITV